MGVLNGIMRVSAAGVNFIVGWFNSAIYDSVAAGQPETNSEGFCWGCNNVSSGLIYTNIWPYFVKDPADYTAASQSVGTWCNIIYILYRKLYLE